MVRVPAENSVSTAKPFANRARLLLAKGAIAPCLFIAKTLMKSIERRFIDLQRKRPSSSSFINFATAVKGQNFSADRIGRWFSELVDRDDYDKHDRPALIRHLVALSQTRDTPEAYGIWGKNASVRDQKVAI